jgi:hypothetical protein
VPLTDANDSTLGIWPSDVPCLAPSASEEAPILVDKREALVLSSVDGQGDVGTILDSVGLPGAEGLAVLCALTARGLITLDRTGRRSLALEPLPVSR